MKDLKQFKQNLKKFNNKNVECITFKEIDNLIELEKIDSCNFTLTFLNKLNKALKPTEIYISFAFKRITLYYRE